MFSWGSIRRQSQQNVFKEKKNVTRTIGWRSTEVHSTGIRLFVLIRGFNLSFARNAPFLLSDLNDQPAIHKMHEMRPPAPRVLLRQRQEMIPDLLARALPIQLRAPDRALHIPTRREHLLERGLLARAGIGLDERGHRVEARGDLVHGVVCRPTLRCVRCTGTTACICALCSAGVWSGGNRACSDSRERRALRREKPPVRRARACQVICNRTVPALHYGIRSSRCSRGTLDQEVS